MTLRTFSMSKAEQQGVDPGKLLAGMKAAGFLFDSEVCPIKIRKPWDSVVTPEGVVIFRQWDTLLEVPVEHDFDVDKVEDWELAVFKAAAYFTVYRQIDPRNKKEFVNFPEAALSCHDDPRSGVYAVTTSGRSVILTRKRWPEYLKAWAEQHGVKLNGQP